MAIMPSSLVVQLLTFLLLKSATKTAAASKPSSSSSYSSSTTTLDPTLEYNVYPLREQSKAAIVEWGHSAIISALDAAVADFGVPTSQSAFFEVETQPVLANPIDGLGNRELKDSHDDGVPYPGPLDNKDEIDGNMVVMTNQAGMSGVTMARIAKESGAAALMVVNIDNDTPDFIYSLTVQNDAEQKYADEHIDFPVVMVSLASGNLITTATVEEGMEEEDIVNNGMPGRVRLYAAGDRPFFEDVSNASPVLYLIHNLLNEDECKMLLSQSKGKFELIDETKSSNLLENIVTTENDSSLSKSSKSSTMKQKAINIEQTMLWKGQFNNHLGKQVEERIEQVTGYPKDQFSDWTIMKHVKGSRHELHYDHHPIHPPVATITVFLNNLDGGDDDEDNIGGEIVYPIPKDVSPVMIEPQMGLAVVHHNTDYEGNVDYTAAYGEMNLRMEGQVKYIARKYVYAQPLPPSKRILLPILAFPYGGKLPKWVIGIHDLLLVKFGLEQGTIYFEKLCTFYPVLVLLIIGTIIQQIIQRQLSSAKTPKVNNNSSNKTKKKSGSSSSDGKKKGKKNKKAD
jgi:hypothetical protein